MPKDIKNYIEETAPHWTALHRAFYDGDVDRIKWLIANDAKVVPDADGYLPHQVSIYSEWKDNADYLARRTIAESLVNPNHVEKIAPHWAALHRAFYDGDVDRTKWLIANGAKVVRDALGYFPHQISPYCQDLDYLERRATCKRIITARSITEESKKKVATRRVRQNALPAPKQRTAGGVSDNFLHRRYFKGGGLVYPPLHIDSGRVLCKEAFAKYLKRNSYYPYDAKMDNPAGPPVEQLDGIYTWAKDTPDDDPVSKVRYTEGPKTKAWMDQREKNYLTRIARENDKKAADAKAIADAKVAADAKKVADAKAADAKKAADEKAVVDAKKAADAKALQDAKAALEAERIAVTNDFQNVGITLLQQADYQKAITCFTHAIAFNPNNALHYLSRAKAYAQLGHYAYAIKDIKKALLLSTNQVDTELGFSLLRDIYTDLSNKFHARGVQLIKEEKYQDALKDFNAEIYFDALRREKKFRGYFPRAQIFDLLQDHKNATNDLEVCLQIQPENQKLKKFRWNIHNNTGVGLLNSDKFQEAVEQFMLAIATDASEAVSHFGLALAYNNLGNDEQALVAVNKSLHLDSKDSNAIKLCGVTHQNLGNKLTEQGKYQEAIVEYDKAIEVLPSFPESYFGLAHVYGKLNNYESALTAVNKCLQLDPNDEDAIHLRESILNSVAEVARVAEAARAAEAARIAEDAKIETERTAANAEKRERIARLTQRLFHRSPSEDQKPNNPEAEFRSESVQSTAVAVSTVR